MPKPAAMELDPEPATTEEGEGDDDAPGEEWLTVQLIAPPPSSAWAAFVAGAPPDARVTVRPVDYFAVQHLIDDAGDDDDAPPPAAASRVVPVVITEIGEVVPLMLDPEADTGTLTADFVGLSPSREAALTYGAHYVSHLTKSLASVAGGES